jgi:hypothetical protein
MGRAASRKRHLSKVTMASSLILRPHFSRQCLSGKYTNAFVLVRSTSIPLVPSSQSRRKNAAPTSTVFIYILSLAVILLIRFSHTLFLFSTLTFQLLANTRIRMSCFIQFLIHPFLLLHPDAGDECITIHCFHLINN